VPDAGGGARERHDHNNDIACTVSIAGGTHDALYIVDQHNSI
jgi:hypothetical protein